MELLLELVYFAVNAAMDIVIIIFFPSQKK